MVAAVSVPPQCRFNGKDNYIGVATLAKAIPSCHSHSTSDLFSDLSLLAGGSAPDSFCSGGPSLDLPGPASELRCDTARSSVLPVVPQYLGEGPVPTEECSSSTQSPPPLTSVSATSADSHQSTNTQEGFDELQDASGLRTIRELQRGSSGVVLLAETSEEQGSTPVAVKLLPRDSHNPALSREILTQRQCLMHPHVIQFKEAILMPRHLAIVMSYAAGGDLREYLENNRPLDEPKGLPEEETRWFFQQIVLAVDFCHRLGIAHQDIKLENALLDRASPRALLKVCDFGYSIHNETNPWGPVFCNRAVGTPDYMAPELLTSPQGYDGKAADVWATGVLLYTMLTGSFPFWRQEDEDGQQDPASRLRCMALRIVQADYCLPEYLSADVRELLSSMLQPRPEERRTIAEVMNHPWFRAGLPPGCTELNEKLLRMGMSRRGSACRQTDADILRITRQMSA